MPSSAYLKLALARVHLYGKEAVQAYPVYKELGDSNGHIDDAIMREVRFFDNVGKRKKGKTKRSKKIDTLF